VFSVQDDITRNVAGALAVELTRVERERAVDKPTENLEAYDYVLRGWSLLDRHERSAHFRAREMFERAIEMDPDYAAAYAGLGQAHHWAIAHGWTEFIVKSIEQAESLAREALSLDPNSVEARRLLASVHVQKGEFDLAAGQLRRALELNPSDAASYSVYGYVHLWSGREEKAIEWYEAALRLDPNMEAGSMADLGVAYYLSGRYDDAVATALETGKRSPDHYMAPIILAAAYAQLDRPAEAAGAAEDVRRVRPFFTIDWMVSSFSDPEDAAHMADGLTKAGLSTPTAHD
jgi:tetratricopeptide (TPR) repeat protein